MGIGSLIARKKREDLIKILDDVKEPDKNNLVCHLGSCRIRRDMSTTVAKEPVHVARNLKERLIPKEPDTWFGGGLNECEKWVEDFAEEY